MNVELYGEYEDLILERDAKARDAGAFHTAYIKEFGELINKSFELKLECIKKKKGIAFCQMYVNRGERVNLTDLEQYLDREMEEYNRQLNDMISTYDRCKKSTVSTELELLKAKTLYRKLAKRLHPDMNPVTAENEELKGLWDRVCDAYKQNDPNKLKELEVLVYAALERLGIEDEMPEIEDIEEKIQLLKEEIERIITTDPYLYSQLLEDSEAVEQKKKDLQNEIDEYTRYAKELDEVLQGLMENGVKMIWKMN